MRKEELVWSGTERLAEKVADEIISLGWSGPIIYGVPRGGIFAAIMVAAALRAKGCKPVLITAPESAHVFIDDVIDKGRTRDWLHQKFPDIPFLALIDKTGKDSSKKSTWIVFPWEIMANEQGAEENIVRILQSIGEDPDREGLKETPRRVVESFGKLFGGYKQNPEGVIKTFKDDTCNEIVLAKNVEFFSTCEHHMLPFFGKAHIAYIPNGKVIGISKLVRILEIYARRLQIQERLCQQITKALDDCLEPKGSACIIEAQHFCMVARGVSKQNSIIVTSSVTGIFLEQPSTREELMVLIKL